MSGIVKVSRTIATKNRDGTWGRLDTSRCISVEGYQASAYYLTRLRLRPTSLATIDDDHSG